ncbi:uncharacterized protein LOC130736501 [Lotus japonicus]|uniref:uncharacterized protein LOC130736501 n=1 Tax=Lotus japonicus TaxID=34305 RepID=UPI0025853440|nr:uncharacterized protein LOC130736501 [Lotus japonicus]
MSPSPSDSRMMKFSTAELLSAFVLSSSKASSSAHAGEKRQSSPTDEGAPKKTDHQGEATASATAHPLPSGDRPNSPTNVLPTPPSPKNADGGKETSPDRPKGPSGDSNSDPFSFLLSHPYLGKLREVPSQNPQDVAQEAVSNLLRVGCLFAQVAWQARPLSGAAELRQEVETLRAANLRFDETCSNLRRQLASEVEKTSKMQKKLAEAKLARAAANEKEEHLEAKIDELKQSLETKDAALAAQEKYLISKEEEIAQLHKDLSDRRKALADARSDLESKCKLLADNDAQTKILEEQMKNDAA